MHLAVSPVLLGCGERLFPGIDTPGLGFEVTDHIAGPGAMHMIIKRK
jgi:hypothetical protein